MAIPARVLSREERRGNIVLQSSRATNIMDRDERNARSARNQFRHKAILMCIASAVLVTFQIAQRELIVRSSYELVSTKSKVNQLQKENDFMKIELASLNSPDRIQAAATSQLGMVVPERVHYVQATTDDKGFSNGLASLR